MAKEKGAGFSRPAEPGVQRHKKIRAEPGKKQDERCCQKEKKSNWIRQGAKPEATEIKPHRCARPKPMRLRTRMPIKMPNLAAQAPINEQSMNGSP